MAVDAAEALAAAQPDFPWADYDVEDQGDRDGDGNLFEPDGALDHVVVDPRRRRPGRRRRRAGRAMRNGRAPRPSIPAPGGYAIPGTGLKLLNFTTQPEDAGVGVIAHEYGHDLGLPGPLRRRPAPADTDVGFWDLMSTGSHCGPLFQSIPRTWARGASTCSAGSTPQVLDYGSAETDVVLGQASRPPAGTGRLCASTCPTSA